MKKINEDVGATAFDYPNNVEPYPYNDIRYGNQYVPHPTNKPAMKVDAAKAMRQVLQGK